MCSCQTEHSDWLLNTIVAYHGKWALHVIFLTYPWIVNTENLPRETSVTLLDTVFLVSRGERAISHGKSAPCNRIYYLDCLIYFGVFVF